MGSFVLTAESTADYPLAFFKEREIPFACFHYELDGENRIDDLYQSTTPHEFFSSLKAGSKSTTSQPNVGEYLELWRPFLEEGRDVLHITLSSGISGAYNSALLASEQAAEAYPDRRVRVVDSLAASSGFGMLVEQLADLRDAGASLDEVGDWAEEHKLELNHWFYVSDLDCLKRGGRVNAASAVIATALKICPVLNVDCKGELIPRQKIRTARRAQSELVRMMLKHAHGGAAYDGRCAIVQSDARDDAEEVARQIGEAIPAVAGKVDIYDIGTVIGSHTGPGTVGVFFMGDKRID